MTVQEMIQTVFEDLTEPEDLEINTTSGDPDTFNFALPGSVRILRVLNEAQNRIASWRFGNGSILRLRSLYSRVYWKVPEFAGQLAVSSTSDTVTIAGLTTNADDIFNGWVCEVTAGVGQGQTNVVVDTVSNGATVTLDLLEDWSTALDATSEITLYKSFCNLHPTGVAGTIDDYHLTLDPNITFSDILKLRDITDGVELERSYYQDTYPSVGFSAGIPTEFYMYGDTIQFNAAIDEPRTYEILYYRYPTALTYAGQIPEMPPQFHEAICLYATHKLQMRAQDFDGSYVTKRNVVDLMNSLRQQGYMTNEMEMGSIVIWG